VAVPGLAILVVATILGGLGTWQVERLIWKQALIARVAARLHAAPEPLPPAADIARAADEAFEYRHVALNGTLDGAHEFHVFGTVPVKDGVGGPGWFVLAPLTLPGGTVLMLNRGFVPDGAKEPATRPEGRLEGPLAAAGILRGRDTRNWLTPADDPARNRYFVRDPQAFAKALGLDPSRVYPVTVDLDAAYTPPGSLPRPGETLVTFPNNHLGYAITWYGLMLTALGVGGVFVRRRWRDAA
jgi:surfeit locus 1 family protein